MPKGKARVIVLVLAGVLLVPAGYFVYEGLDRAEEADRLAKDRKERLAEAEKLLEYLKTETDAEKKAYNLRVAEGMIEGADITARSEKEWRGNANIDYGIAAGAFVVSLVLFVVGLRKPR